MVQIRPVFVQEAARLLAEIAEKAASGEAFARALEGEAATAVRGDGWTNGPPTVRRPQPERATGFAIHASLPDGPEGTPPRLGLAAYAARMAERVVLEGPVANFSVRI